MSGLSVSTRNVTDFRSTFRELRRQEEHVFRPTIAEHRERLARSASGAPAPSDQADGALEAHIRICFVDHLLLALNWDLPGADTLRPALWPEVPVLAENANGGEDVILFLDYFGVERHSDSPLLIVETKRPDATLPRVGKRRSSAVSTRGSFDAQRERLAEDIAATIAKALGAGKGAADRGVTKEWAGWLDKMSDYVAAIVSKGLRAPSRVVFTNGSWIVTFVAAIRSFGGNPTPEDIVVFLDRDDVDDRASELFRLLAYQNVAEDRRPLVPQEVPLFVEPSSVNGYMHGLRVLHAEEPTLFANAFPRMAVSPVVLLRSARGSWVEVLIRKEHVIPIEPDRLDEHVRVVDEDARQLLADTLTALGTPPPPLSLRDHFAVDEQVRSLPGVVELRERAPVGRATEYRVVTGTHTHFVRAEPSVPNCPYHSWSTCSREGRAHTRLPEAVPTLQPRRNFFVDGRPHHCAHDGVGAIKAAPLNPSNRSRSGNRSGADGVPFCEVFAFDQTLCCRTCAFEEACASAPVFRLPCSDNQDPSRKRLPIV